MIPADYAISLGVWLSATGAAFAVNRVRRHKPALRRRSRHLISAILGPPYGPRPQGTWKARRRQWHERLYFHLSRAEWDSRVRLGVSLSHPERVVYVTVDPEAWQALEDWLWPGGCWTDVIEAHWREEEQRRQG